MKKCKKISAIILTIAMAISGIYLAPQKVQEVQAAETVSSYEVVPKASTIVTKDQESGKVTKVVVNAEDATYGKYASYLFAGWVKQGEAANEYVAASETDATFAKFVSRDTLSVKFQIAASAVTDTDDAGNPIQAESAIRFISSVDSMDYSGVGFEVSYKDASNDTVTKNYFSRTVYEKIDSTMKEGSNKKDYSFSPKVVGGDSEYFFTAKLAVPSAKAERDYTVKAYWQTMDGVKVYGDSRKVCVADNDMSIINMTVNEQLDSNATYAATANNLEIVNVEVLTSDAYSSSVRLTVNGSVANLPSATKITLNDGTTNVATAVYRNYYTTHVIAGSEAVNADTTWYEAYKENDGTSDYLTTDHFVIASSADLYGLAKIVNSIDDYPQYKFSGKTITLIRDVEINAGNSETWGSSAPDYNWTPIGESDTTYGFRGTFNGDDNAIRGLYYYKKNASSNTETNAGLFGYVHSSCVIKNVRLMNSYIYVYNGVGIGGIIGASNGGTIQNVYSNATVIGDANSNSVGQFVGKLINGITLENCWSDGTVKGMKTAGNGPTYVGGFIGYCSAASKKSTVMDCLHTGEIESARTSNYPCVGGFCGMTDKANTEFTFTNYVDAGKITVASATMTGLYFGRANSNTWKATFTNCYAAGELKDSTKSYTYVINWKSGTFTGLPTATSLSALSQKTVAEMFGEHATRWEKVNGEIPFVLTHFTDM